VNRGARTLAWALGLTGVVACIAAAGVVLAFRAPSTFLVTYLVGVVLGLIGALVASRDPRNSIGWLMCASSIAVSLTHLPAGYGYFALVLQHGAWPLGGVAIWLGAWGYVVILGLFLPIISVRFPDGKVLRRWRFVDWVAILGTVLFASGIALQPWNVLVDFLPIPAPDVARLSSHIEQSHGVLNQVQGFGLALIVVGYVAGAASIAARYRRAQGDVRVQLRWFVYSGALIAAAFVYGAVAWNFLGVPLYLALTPFEFAVLTLPIAIAVAILRYHLYDIDLIINRTLVYSGLTAILGAVYAAVVTLLNRLFISLSGQRSDAAYVVTAFVVVIASSPVKDWLQRQVDRRFPHRSPSAVLDEFRGDVDAVVSVIDVRRVLRRLVDEAVTAFDARSAALYLEGDGPSPVHSFGDDDRDVALEVDLRHDGRLLGRLVMGSRRGDVEYTPEDREALQRSANSVAEALALTDQLGLRRASTVAVTSRPGAR
jgi:two-component system, NarL family, sensor kinase